MNIDLSQLSVLVVDDSRTLRRILVRELNNMGVSKVVEATDGSHALEVLQTNTVDLVLLDMEMPELDGLQVLQRMKSSAALMHLPVIVISSADEIEKTVRCIEMGAEDYLPKNFNPVLLRARVSSSFEKKLLRDSEKIVLDQLKNEKEMLQQEQLKTDRLMLNILPKSIAERLKNNQQNISDGYDDVTILFSDLVEFTNMALKIDPAELVKMLNDLFTRFDKRAEKLGIEKIKTIGDAYMAASGLPIPRSDHAHIAADMALGMFEDLKNFNQLNGREIKMRIGLNSGPVVAGIIGFSKFSYDLWGSTINVASRMESTSLSNKIQLSETTKLKIQESYNTKPRALVECKGLGKIMTYFLESAHK